MKVASFYQNKKALIAAVIRPEDLVLDVGFWGQGTDIDNPNWVHSLLKKQAKEVYGLDLYFDLSKLDNKQNYLQGSAENFSFDQKFDVIFAGDLIEHLSNPGLFLDSCRQNLKPGGRLIMTTPNCFNLFNLMEKISKYEPTTNSDHTCYFNVRTIKQLLQKNNWQLNDFTYLYSLDSRYRPSWKKKVLNLFYWVISKVTNKYLETMVIITQPN